MLDVIIRKTYGFNKKNDRISTSQFIETTGLNRGSVYKARRKLREMNIISISQKGDGSIATYYINKFYKTWRVSPKKETVSQKVDEVSPKSDEKCLPNCTPQKKERNIQKKDRFVPPSLEAVKSYCSEISAKINPAVFFDHYTGNGWLIGKSPMRDWKATVRNWDRRESGKSSAGSYNPNKKLSGVS